MRQVMQWQKSWQQPWQQSWQQSGRSTFKSNLDNVSNLYQIFVKSQKHHSLADWVSNMNQRVVLGKEALVFIRCSWSAKFNHVRVISNWTEFGWIIQNQWDSFGVMKLILQFSDNACLKPCIKVQNLQYKFFGLKMTPSPWNFSENSSVLVPPPVPNTS